MNKTRIAPLPYKGAPLTVQDIIQQQVNFEDQFLSHINYMPQDGETKEKELPSQVWSPTARYVFGVNVRLFKFFLP